VTMKNATKTVLGRTWLQKEFLMRWSLVHVYYN
jgi:hypothetical protein